MAPSKESGALAELFKTFAQNFPSDGNVYKQRAIYDQVHKAAAEVPGVSYEDAHIIGGSLPCIWIRPDGATNNHVILFMHGGGFSFGSPNSHRKVAAHLAKACNCLALSVDYRLTPENTYPDPLDDCVAAYHWLLDQGFEAKHIVTAGDSCGGSLSTVVPMAAIRKGLPKPAAAVSLSPWYDLTGSGESMNTNETNDVLNTKPFVAEIARRYTINAKKEDPLISPIFASEEELRELPPHWISAGGYDMLVDNATRFAEKAGKAGVEVVLEVHDGQQHVMEFMAGKAPEADESIRKIGAWIKQKIGSGREQEDATVIDQISPA